MHRRDRRNQEQPTAVLVGAKALDLCRRGLSPDAAGRRIERARSPSATTGQPPSLIADWTTRAPRGERHAALSRYVSIELERPARRSRRRNGETMFNAKRADIHGRMTEGSPRDHPVMEVTAASGRRVREFSSVARATGRWRLNAIVRGFDGYVAKALGRPDARNPGGRRRASRSNHCASRRPMPSWLAPERSAERAGQARRLVRVAVVGIEHIVPLLGIDRLIGQGIDQFVRRQRERSTV